jgi:hypothetical protein
MRLGRWAPFAWGLTEGSEGVGTRCRRPWTIGAVVMQKPVEGIDLEEHGNALLSRIAGRVEALLPSSWLVGVKLGHLVDHLIAALRPPLYLRDQ